MSNDFELSCSTAIKREKVGKAEKLEKTEKEIYKIYVLDHKNLRVLNQDNQLNHRFRNFVRIKLKSL